MTGSVSRLDLEAIEKRCADDEAGRWVADLASGKRQWRMRVPVDEYDTDVVLMQVVEDREALLTEVRRLQAKGSDWQSAHGPDAPFDIGAVSSLHKEADERNLLARGVVRVDTRNDEVVERVAQAVRLATPGRMHDEWSWVPKPVREGYRATARAVLAALLDGEQA